LKYLQGVGKQQNHCTGRIIVATALKKRHAKEASKGNTRIVKLDKRESDMDFAIMLNIREADKKSQVNI
jgi:hypothetical protein